MSRSGLLFLLLLLYSCTVFAQDVRITDPWIKEAPPGVRVMAGYLLLENSDSKPLVLTGVRSPEFDRVELHRSVIEDDVVRMEAQDVVTVAPNDTLAFQPGGYHLMLYDPQNRLSAGDWIELQFSFTGGREISVAAKVRRDTGVKPDQHHHHHH